jgi:EAL domain-containing protein (putative c-di-GMP-specific phosphodiesterase class I)/GGDEF domain-containing protein
LSADDTLAAAARDAGWTIAADAAAATIAVIDARGDLDAACSVLGDSAAATRLALVGDVDGAAQDRLIAAGATQIAVIAPMGEGLAQALRLATPDRRARAAEETVLERWIARRLARLQPMAVVHVTIVRLDLVNAAHGRDAGTLLVEAAERRIAAQVAAIAEEDGSVVRADGAAFVVALALPAERVVLAAARIEEALARPFRLAATTAVLGTRIGLASARAGEGAQVLLARAAAAAAAPAKPAVDDPLAVDIHLALARGEVRLLFQPQEPTAGGGIVGVEALGRWYHPVRGFLGAEALFTAADRAGIAAALAEHIHGRLLAEVAAWPKGLAALRIALNLTAADLARPGFVDTLLAQVDASGIARERLTLEVTETELMTDLDAAAAALRALQEAGCRTAIDDFGTGYSSLAYLAALPVDYLKLDRSLTQEIVGPPRRQVVVRAAIDMARSLGITVVAEGVEEDVQRDALAEAGCKLYQGFLLAPPLDGEALIRLMEDHR